MALFEKKTIVKNQIDYQKLAKAIARETQTTIDYDKLAEAIVAAHGSIIERDKAEEERANQERQTEWQRHIGYKEYSGKKNLIIRLFHGIRNFIVTLFCVLFFRAKNADGAQITFGMMRLAARSLFWTYEYTLYAGIAILGYALWKEPSIRSWLWCVPVFIAFLFARLFRIAKLETDNMTDRETISTVFSANYAFIGMVLAIAAIIAEVV